MENQYLKFVLSDYSYEPPEKEAQTVIIDPPYNVGFNYKGKYNDNLHEEDYENLIYDVLEFSYDNSTEQSSLFLINYPEIVFDLHKPIKDSRWKIHQWISWVYPSNIGKSKRKFTTAHRIVLWLTKDNPKINIRSITQPYKNPNDKRVKKLIENGSTGTNLYNWWEINLCKNVSKDKKNYVNQIPEELLKRLILTTSDKGDLIFDPMCGSGSTLSVAQKNERFGFGCDINSDLIPIWEDILNET